MRIYNKTLRKAMYWLRTGRSASVIKFLEPKVPLFLEDPIFYMILGRSCLEAGLIKDAETYLNRGVQADPHRLDILLSLAVCALKRKNPSEAVRIWLEILDEDPKQKQARKGLNTLKKITDQETQDLFLQDFDPKAYLSPLGPLWPRWLIIGAVILLFALVAFYFWRLGGPGLPWLGGIRPGTETLTLTGVSRVTGSSSDVLYPMKDREVSRNLRLIRSFFNDYRDNSVRRELNRIKNSNASEEVKARTLALESYLSEPSLESFDESFPPAAVFTEPRLYEGCWILWRGKVANIVYGEERLHFDFLVGEEQVFEGAVPVRVPFIVVMEDLPLELLARVEVEGDTVVLTAKTLHFLR